VPGHGRLILAGNTGQIRNIVFFDQQGLDYFQSRFVSKGLENQAIH
jgi:hypothetical protein